MEELEMKNAEIPRLYLEKLELLNERERAVLIKVIELIANPMFVAQ